MSEKRSATHWAVRRASGSWSQHSSMEAHTSWMPCRGSSGAQTGLTVTSPQYSVNVCVWRCFCVCTLSVFAQITLIGVGAVPLTVWLIQLLGISGLPRSRTTLSFMLSTHGFSLRFPKGGSYSFTSAHTNTKNEPVMSSDWSSLVIWCN